MAPLVECVPNFSEGRDRRVIDAIAQSLSSVGGAKLLDVDPGAETNRTVYTLVGSPESVSEAAYRGAVRAVELIDMSAHRGQHPRLGAMDVCPFVPVAGITMAECVTLARALGGRIGETLAVPVYYYEHAATVAERRSLAAIRSGEYEGLPQKLADPAWQPDAGPAVFNPRSGAFVVGAREFLLAYNVNLNTFDRKLAHEIALTIREAGRITRDASGHAVVDEQGQPARQPGRLKAVRAIGWYIDQYKQAQVSINLLDFRITTLSQVFETVREEAEKLGLLVTGSELVGLTPLEPILEAGRHFLRKQRQSTARPEEDVVAMAVRSLGLDQVAPFDPGKKIIEYHFREAGLLAARPVRGFVDEVSRESPTPGGGSVAALAGSLAAALASMVANLTAGRSAADTGPRAIDIAERCQYLKDRLLEAVDADAAAYDAVLAALRMPRGTPEQERTRSEAAARASREATRIPLESGRLCAEVAALAVDAADIAPAHTVSDAGVAACLARAGAEGAALNVLINLDSLDDDALRAASEREANASVERARTFSERALAVVARKLSRTSSWLEQPTNRAGAAG